MAYGDYRVLGLRYNFIRFGNSHHGVFLSKAADPCVVEGKFVVLVPLGCDGVAAGAICRLEQ